MTGCTPDILSNSSIAAGQSNIVVHVQVEYFKYRSVKKKKKEIPFVSVSMGVGDWWKSC